MSRPRARLSVVALGLAAGLALAGVRLAPASQAQGLAFGPPRRLPHWAGGEPSLAFDPSGNGSLYVVAPQSTPAVANGLLPGVLGESGEKGGEKGVGFWASHDGGRTFPVDANIGSALGGGDSDVEVGDDHTVYVADLETVAAAVCRSTDGGRSFSSAGVLPGACNGLPLTHAGPENDRPWLTRAPGNELYLTYHDFVAGFPLIMRSTDRGATFLPCGLIIDPGGPAARNYNPANGTLLAKPVVDGRRIYVQVSEPDFAALPLGATINHLYIAVADRPCGATTVFRNRLVYEDRDADLGNIFDAITVDGGGTVYVVAAGRTASGQSTENIWLFSSHDGGDHWSAPVRVNAPNLRANALPAVAGGRGKDQVAVGWFGTESATKPSDPKAQWRYYAATSADGGRTFEQATVTPEVVHHGDICTQGLFCAVPGTGGNRNLADFSSVAVDPSTGCVAVAFPGDPENRPDVAGGRTGAPTAAFVALQSAGACFSGPGPSRAPAPGGAAPAARTDASATSRPTVLGGLSPPAARTDERMDAFLRAAVSLAMASALL